jgi:cytochrome c-type biogenesis protein CcmE
MDPALPRSSKRTAKLLIGTGVILAVLGTLVVWAMARPGSTAFYVTTSELVAHGPTDPGQELKVNGKVVAGSIHQEGIHTTFDVSDGHRAVTVTTDQPLPDAFKEGSDVVARGSYDGRLVTATEVLAKCPSKFKAKA